jgi:hypothetical protein
MSPAANTKTTEASEQEIAPKNAAQVKKAITLGKEMMKKGDVTKADVARAMYELIHEEVREVIVSAFVEGATLTPKGAQTYFYNCKRKMAKGS